MSNLNIGDFLVPISENAPAGDDARYEFCYEMMEVEVKKYGSLFGETVDWNVVKIHAVEVITQHSKDLKAISYLIRALVEECKFEGLELGFNLLSQSLASFGCDLFPRRKRGRDGALEWLVGQLESTLLRMGIEHTSWEQLSRCNALLDEIQEQYHAAFPDSEVEFYGIRPAFNSLMERATMAQTDTVNKPMDVDSSTVNEPTVENNTPQASITPIQPQLTPVKPARPEVDVDTDFSTPSASKRSLKRVAEAILHAELGAPLAYRVHRYLTWCDIDELPGHNQEKKTPLALAVSQDQQADYRDKAKQHTDPETIKRLERTLTDAPFWLTGHHLMYQMLKSQDLEDAALAVKQEVINFTKSLPGIEELKFTDSVPFADEATIEWLSSGLQSSSSNHPPMQTVVLTDDELSSLDNITLETLGECVADIAHRLEKDSSGRGQFMLHLQMIKAYHCVGLFSLCLPYLEKIWTVREEMALARWEPHLCLQLDSLVETTLSALYPNKENMPEKYQEWTSINN